MLAENFGVCRTRKGGHKVGTATLFQTIILTLSSQAWLIAKIAMFNVHFTSRMGRTVHRTYQGWKMASKKT